MLVEVVEGDSRGLSREVAKGGRRGRVVKGGICFLWKMR